MFIFSILVVNKLLIYNQRMRNSLAIYAKYIDIQAIRLQFIFSGRDIKQRGVVPKFTDYKSNLIFLSDTYFAAAFCICSY